MFGRFSPPADHPTSIAIQALSERVQVRAITSCSRICRSNSSNISASRRSRSMSSSSTSSCTSTSSSNSSSSSVMFDRFLPPADHPTSIAIQALSERVQVRTTTSIIRINPFLFSFLQPVSLWLGRIAMVAVASLALKSMTPPTVS